MPASPYTDLERPPLLGRSLQRALLVPGGLWRRLEVRAETGSTNADVAAAARAGEPEGPGRGRRAADRRPGPPGPAVGLAAAGRAHAQRAAAARVEPAVPDAGDWGWLPLLAGVALREAVQRLAEVDAR